MSDADSSEASFTDDSESFESEQSEITVSDHNLRKRKSSHWNRQHI